MVRRSSLSFYLGVAAVAAGACRSAAGTATDPVNPTPMATPSPSGPTAGAAGRIGAGDDMDTLPIRPEQAPMVVIREIIDGKIPLGRRVRVSGRCIEAGTGRSAGLWTLADDSAQVEVRGLVPKRCPSKLDEKLTIFAQVEWKTNRGPERLLLRLPGQ